jgi:DNA uptake protein ComE-like DNA-binding protein
MKRIMQTVLMAAALLLSASWCLAAESKMTAPGQATGAPRAAQEGAKSRKPAAPAEPVDINSASKAQLKKIPGISGALADRIIAGRPYLSKAHLVTHNIISGAQYAQIKYMIVARQK